MRKRLSAEMRRTIWTMFNCHCAYCGCKITLNEMQADHVVPLHRGGKDEIDNLFPACRSCNHYKSTMTVEEFREQIGKWHERLMRDNVTYKNAIRFGQIVPNPHRAEFYFETEVTNNA